MFERQSMMYIYVETPLHAGSGRAVGVVDLPIQRERVTGYPLVQSSGIKGRLRAELYAQVEVQVLEKNPHLRDIDKIKAKDEREKKAAELKRLVNLVVEPIFGPEKVTADSDAYAGAASFGDARILLFPVQSLYGVFAYVTSANILARLARDLTAAGVGNKKLNDAIAALDKDKDKDNVYAGKTVAPSDKSDASKRTLVLEEFSYTGCEDVPDIIADFLKNALPKDSEYAYWRDSLAGRLVILPEEDFRDFVCNSTEVVTRTRLDPNTKTVANGALWSEESLPSDTLLYCPLAMGKQRKKDSDSNERDAKELQKILAGKLDGQNLDEVAYPLAAQLLQKILAGALDGKRIRLGGDETVGRGCVALHFGEGSSNGK